MEHMSRAAGQAQQRVTKPSIVRDGTAKAPHAASVNLEASAALDIRIHLPEAGGQCQGAPSEELQMNGPRPRLPCACHDQRQRKRHGKGEHREHHRSGVQHHARERQGKIPTAAEALQREAAAAEQVGHHREPVIEARDRSRWIDLMNYRSHRG
jgi:hypothetical protein